MNIKFDALQSAMRVADKGKIKFYDPGFRRVREMKVTVNVSDETHITFVPPQSPNKQERVVTRGPNGWCQPRVLWWRRDGGGQGPEAEPIDYDPGEGHDDAKKIKPKTSSKERGSAPKKSIKERGGAPQQKTQKKRVILTLPDLKRKVRDIEVAHLGAHPLIDGAEIENEATPAFTRVSSVDAGGEPPRPPEPQRSPTPPPTSTTMALATPPPLPANFAPPPPPPQPAAPASANGLDPNILAAIVTVMRATLAEALPQLAATPAASALGQAPAVPQPLAAAPAPPPPQPPAAPGADAAREHAIAVFAEAWRTMQAQQAPAQQQPAPAQPAAAQQQPAPAQPAVAPANALGVQPLPTFKEQAREAGVCSRAGATVLHGAQREANREQQQVDAVNQVIAGMKANADGTISIPPPMAPAPARSGTIDFLGPTLQHYCQSVAETAVTWENTRSVYSEPLKILTILKYTFELGNDYFHSDVWGVMDYQQMRFVTPKPPEIQTHDPLYAEDRAYGHEAAKIAGDIAEALNVRRHPQALEPIAKLGAAFRARNRVPGALMTYGEAYAFYHARIDALTAIVDLAKLARRGYHDQAKFEVFLTTLVKSRVMGAMLLATIAKATKDESKVGAHENKAGSRRERDDDTYRNYGRGRGHYQQHAQGPATDAQAAAPGAINNNPPHAANATASKSNAAKNRKKKKEAKKANQAAAFKNSKSLYYSYIAKTTMEDRRRDVAEFKRTLLNKSDNAGLRRRIAEYEWHRAIAAEDPLIALVAMGVAKLKPSVALQRMAAAARMKPEVRKNPIWTHMAKQYKIQSNRPEHKVKKAAPATPGEVRRLIGDLTTPQQCAIWVAWLTAGRLGDSLSAALEVYDHLICVHFPDRQKSDQAGERKIKKWIARKGDAAEMWETGLAANLDATRKHIKATAPRLTGHSIRRGAIQQLDVAGYTPEDICILSGHKPPSEAKWGQRGLSAYLESNPTRLRATMMKAIEMSRVLRAAVTRPSVPTAPKTPESGEGLTNS
jgi:hypothetical protein